ncbi:hypothetical protein HD597_003790 [Nonomuraea thailandensis]|uniref:Uncharacterized protein n=1 Tax=Nonomuraea thailandensis TaxID=1188745 RepID=A0A9X2K272_9ACTN|nr:hypothetical protein [Nonomuraea thailandensis]MCP2356770.1 hypothetical protein [Nonomuraea thailandensis]
MVPAARCFPAAAGCGAITYERRRAPGPPEPTNTSVISDCDQTVPAVAAGLACALGVAATGLCTWRLRRAGAGRVAPSGREEVHVVGPGEVRLGDVDGTVVQAGSVLGSVLAKGRKLWPLD